MMNVNKLYKILSTMHVIYKIIGITLSSIIVTIIKHSLKAYF